MQSRNSDGFVCPTLVIQSASELLALAMHRLSSQLGKIYSDSGKIISEEAWEEKQGTAA